ncbi:MAG: GTP 3',8-cyclase MoaA [Gemmatimonadota bacterium]
MIANADARPASPRDLLGRPLGSLRLSVTDRCNMRCSYCMPEESYVWLPRASILSYEEMARLAGIFAELGAQKVRLTGGEPLLRHDLPRLVGLLRESGRITDLALTTNGILLSRNAHALRDAGLSRITVSLDTLRPGRMEQFARSSQHAEVIAGIDAAGAAGFSHTRINTVVIRGFNEDELVDLIEFGRARHVEVRFIEYMDVGGATQWSMRDVVSAAEILSRLGQHYGRIEPLGGRGAAPAERFALADGTTFGVIASTTRPFCRDCDRSRVTADGTWFLCLYGQRGIDLREPLRSGARDDELRTIIHEAWLGRTDRGAEVRAGEPDRAPLYQMEGLRSDPHREMHTRGG